VKGQSGGRAARYTVGGSVRPRLPHDAGPIVRWYTPRSNAPHATTKPPRMKRSVRPRPSASSTSMPKPPRMVARVRPVGQLPGRRVEYSPHRRGDSGERRHHETSSHRRPRASGNWDVRMHIPSDRGVSWFTRNGDVAGLGAGAGRSRISRRGSPCGGLRDALSTDLQLAMRAGGRRLVSVLRSTLGDRERRGCRSRGAPA
jgi:hypothetical protein